MVSKIQLYLEYSCIQNTVVSRIHLYPEYSCIQNTVVSRIQLYPEYSCNQNSVVSRIKWHPEYSSIQNTVVSKLQIIANLFMSNVLLITLPNGFSTITLVQPFVDIQASWSTLTFMYSGKFKIVLGFKN